MRKFGKTIALILTVAMVLSTFGFTAVFAADFNDTAGHWAETEISKWSGAGVINGYEDGSFDPDAYISRAELAQIIATAMEYTTEADISFTDVSGDEWFTDALRKCVAQGVIGGYEDGTFRPDDAVTREEAATMFQRAYKINSVGLLSFTDTDSISEWAKTSVTALVGAGVINGYEDGTFNPEGYITRAEVVKILDGITDAAVADDSTMSGANTDASTGSNSSIGSLGNRGSVTSSGSSSSGSSSSSSTTYNVTFNANGGTIGTSATSKVVAITKNTTIGSKAPEATRDGYIFDGWYTTVAAANTLNSTYLVDLSTKTVTSNTTLYAGWYEDADMTVTFEANGGSPVPESQTVKSGSTASKPSTDPTRTNYTFAGWYSDNAAKYEFDFDEDIIKVDTTIYAGWVVDSAYAASEVTIPTTTTGTYRTGTVESSPYSALPGESVTLKITPPTASSGQYGIETTPYISYTSTSGETVTLALSDGDYTYTEYGYYTYVIDSLPSDIASDLQVVVSFKSVPAPSATATAEPTATPTATPDPTATPTIDPYAPTATPSLTTSYVFSEGGFAGLSSFPANTDIDGLTVSKASSIDSSSKSFAVSDEYPDNSGMSYSVVLKLGTATLTFPVEGPCGITIDAVSANSSNTREFSLKSGSTTLATFSCVGGVNESFSYYYNGEATTLSIVPAAGINVYGIYVTKTEGGDVPEATATPTADPSASYDISIDESIANGTISVSNGSMSTDDITTLTWTAESLKPTLEDGSIDSSAVVMKEGDYVYMNGVDASDGTITVYNDVTYYENIESSTGLTYGNVRGQNNPTFNPPFSDTHSPGGNVFRVVSPRSGYLTFKVYIYVGKSFYIYDNANTEYIVGPDISAAEDIYTYTIPCEEGGSYYLYASGSKIGLAEVTYTSGSLTARAGQTITVTTKGDEGYQASTVYTDPETTVTNTATNTYTFTMPASDVTIGAEFTPDGTVAIPTATPTAEPTADPDADYTVSVSSSITGGTLSIVQPAATEAPGPAEDGSETYSAVGYSGDTAAGTVLYDGTTFTLTAAWPGLIVDTNGQGVKNNGGGNLTVTDTDVSENKSGRGVFVYTAKADGTLTVTWPSLGSGKSGYVALATADSTATSSASTDTVPVYTGYSISKLKLIKNSEAESAEAVFSYDVEAGNTYMIGGCGTDAVISTVKYTPASATASLAADDEVLVSTMTAKAGDTITLKAVAATAGDAIAVSTDPETEITDLGDGYYSFTMPASDVTANATFGDAVEPTADPDADYTVSVAVGITGGTLSIVQPAATETPVETEAPTDEPVTDYIETTPVTAETTWTFSTSSMADYLEDFTVSGSTKKYLKGNTSYEGLEIYAAVGTLNEDGTKVSGSVVEVDDGKKTVDDVDYVGRLKLGGTGTDNGGDSVRIVTLVPGVDGTLTITAAHASSSGTDRQLAVMQGDTNINEGMTLAAGASATASFDVTAGTIVRIYSLGSGINIHGMTFTPGDGGDSSDAAVLELNTVYDAAALAATDTDKISFEEWFGYSNPSDTPNYGYGGDNLDEAAYAPFESIYGDLTQYTEYIKNGEWEISGDANTTGYKGQMKSFTLTITDDDDYTVSALVRNAQGDLTATFLKEGEDTPTVLTVPGSGTVIGQVGVGNGTRDAGIIEASLTLTPGVYTVTFEQGGFLLSALTIYSGYPVGTASLAADDEVLVSTMTAKAGDTITLKAVADNAGDAITILSTPELTISDLGDGYYSFTMPASDVSLTATFGSEEETNPTETPAATATATPSSGEETGSILFITTADTSTLEDTVYTSNDEISVISVCGADATLGSFNAADDGYDSLEIDGITFTNFLKIKLNTNLSTSEDESFDLATNCTALYVNPKVDGQFVIYYRRQNDGGTSGTIGSFTAEDGKDMFLASTSKAKVAGTSETITSLGDGSYGYGTRTWDVTGGEKYVLWAKGTTGTLMGYDFIPAE